MVNDLADLRPQSPLKPAYVLGFPHHSQLPPALGAPRFLMSGGHEWVAAHASYTSSDVTVWAPMDPAGRVRVEQRLYSLTHHATGCSSVEVLSMTVGMDLATQALLATGLLSAQGEANTQRAPPTHPTPPTTAAPPTPLPAPPSVPAATPTHSQAAADASRQQQLQQSAPSVASVGGSRGGVRGSTAAGSGGEVGGGGEGSGERPGAALAGGMKLGLTDQVGCVCC